MIRIFQHPCRVGARSCASLRHALSVCFWINAACVLTQGAGATKKLAPPEPDLLFFCAFTNETLRAEYAAGDAQGENEKSDYVEFRKTVRGKGIFLGQNVAIRFLEERNIRQEQGTLEFWVTYPEGKDISKWDDPHTVESGILFTFKEEGNNGFYIWKQTNGGGYLVAPDAEGKVDYSCAFKKDNWNKAVPTYLAFTWDESGCASFVDGRAYGKSKAPFLRTQAGAFYVGPGINSLAAQHSNAIVQELRIFSRVLDAGEIIERYNAQLKE
ncbi:MAG: hypothetical protein HY360_24030 [Verrucomicrobia bacterium]|nr:hypothetical protein [Verrucomicrobiota bacterium]